MLCYVTAVNLGYKRLSLIECLGSKVADTSGQNDGSSSLGLFVAGAVRYYPRSVVLQGLVRGVVEIILYRPEQSERSPPRRPSGREHLTALISPFATSVHIPLIRTPTSPLASTSSPLSRSSDVSGVLVHSRRRHFLSYGRPSHLSRTVDRVFRIPLQGVSSGHRNGNAGCRAYISLRVLVRGVL